MKIGIQINFLDFRNDIRKIIKHLSIDNKIILFVNDISLYQKLNFDDINVELREIKEKKRSFYNRFINFLFSRFGKIPASKNNYYILERFLISLESNILKRKFNYFKFDIFFHFPKFISYDYYLSLITYKSETKINDIEKFIIFTRVSNNYFLSRLIKEKKK